MGKFEAEIPLEMMREIESFANEGAGLMMEDMLNAAGDYLVEEVAKNAEKVFKNPDTVLRGLKKTVIYDTQIDDAKNVKVGIYGYAEDGTPLPLIANAREYGSSSGEEKKPFLRPAFRKAKITQILAKAQDEYFEKHFKE